MSDALFGLGTMYGVGFLVDAVTRRVTDRGFGDPSRTSWAVEGEVSLDLALGGPGAGVDAGLAARGRMTVTEDHDAGTTTDSVLVGYDASSELGGMLGALLAADEVSAIVDGQGSGQAGLAVTRDAAGRALELVVTTVTSPDGGDTLERTVRGLDLTVPTHRGLSEVLSSTSSSPARRADELALGAVALAAGLGTSYRWGAVVRERYERRTADGPNVAVDVEFGPSASATTDNYVVTRRTVE
ncbi:MAG: hypothetical protein GEV08_00790 [Acidimicrobiia bacterium]|nr:hypothetical protein [Acidimicrobiia bacterium]